MLLHYRGLSSRTLLRVGLAIGRCHTVLPPGVAPRMPKKGIHPVLQTVTYVLKNGASIELPSIMHRSSPYMLQTVRV